MLNNDSSWHRDFSNCTVLKASKSKKLLRGPVDPAAPDESSLIKIYFYPGLWQAAKYFFRKSKARRELALAVRISEKGIPTIIPEKIKDIRKWGLLEKSIVLMPYLPDCVNLEELLLMDRFPATRLKREVLREYGKLARLIHDQGIYQDDFDPNNMLYQQKRNGSFQLYFLDFERTRIVKQLAFGQRAHSLAKLNRMGRRLGRTDQMRFLAAYLGPQATRNEKREWVTRIAQEEKKVLLKDLKRAGKECLSENNRIGSVSYEGYKGYFRKRHHSRDCYSRSDMIRLIQILEEKITDDTLRHLSPGRFLDITVPLENGDEPFAIRFFDYSGWKYRLPKRLMETPLIAAWKADNGCLKNRSARFLPVAALEKRRAWNRFHGFLVRKN